jgi:hypothetical protein
VKAMDIILSIPWIIIALGLIVGLKSLRVNGVSNTLLTALFMAKILGAFALQWIYTFFYTERSTADIYRFFDDGLILSSLVNNSASDYFRIMLGLYDEGMNYYGRLFETMNCWLKPFESGFYKDNHFMIKLNSLFNFLTENRFESNAIIFSTLAFIGILKIVSSLISNPSIRNIGLFIGVMFPSSLLMIWGGLKEIVMIFGAGLLLSIFFDSTIRQLSIVSRGLISLVALICLVSVKPYFLSSSLIALIAFQFTRQFEHPRLFHWYAWAGLCFITLLSFYLVGIDVLAQIVQKQHDFLNHAISIKAGSAIVIERLSWNWMSLIKALPTSLFNSIFRPLPWEASSLSEILMLFENGLVLMLFVIALIGSLSRPSRSVKFTLALQIGLPVLCLIGLISSVLGATMRYRAPFILIILISLIPFLFSIKSKKSQA